jgi:transmembrane sensor
MLIAAASSGVRVAVADGAVAVTGAMLAEPVELSEGRALVAGGALPSVRVQAVAVDQVGSWRDGQLSYDSVPLALVAADIARYAGLKVEVADEVATRQFSGTLVIGDGQAALRDLSRLMDLRLDRSAGGYRLGR